MIKKNKWFVVMTKPKQEIIAKLNLENQDFLVLLPMLKLDSEANKKEPLFPSYLFVNFDPEDYKWLKISNTRGVKKILKCSIHPKEVDKEFVKLLLDCTDKFGLLKKTLHKYKINQKIKIINGPFRKMLGEVKSLSPENRVKVLMNELIINLDGRDIIPL